MLYTILEIDYQILNCYCLSGWCTKSKGCFGVSSWCDAGNGILNILSFFKGDLIFYFFCMFLYKLWWCINCQFRCATSPWNPYIYNLFFGLLFDIWSNTLIVSVISQIVASQLMFFFFPVNIIPTFFKTNIKFNYIHLFDLNFPIHTSYYVWVGYPYFVLSVFDVLLFVAC